MTRQDAALTAINKYRRWQLLIWPALPIRVHFYASILISHPTRFGERKRGFDVTAIAIERTQRYSIRKVAAVVAGILVLGTATTATVAAWNDSADQASFDSRAGVVLQQGSAAVG